MTQQPFSRPGAIDLSGLKRPAGPPGPAGQQAAGGGAGPASPYAVEVTEQNFQETVEASMTAPVLLVLYSRSQLPESGQLADDLATLSAEFDGRFLAGLVDVDRSPAIAQAMQVPSIPLVLMVLDGRPVPLLQDVVPIDQLRTALTQVMQQLATQGVTTRHQPRATVPAEPEAEDGADPRYAAAEDALAAGDVERAVAEYQRLVEANAADTQAAAGLAMARVLLRAQGNDPATARARADAVPDDVAAQTLVADLDLLDGRLEEAFGRLVELVRRTAGEDRDAAREHLLGLFAAVGNEDPRVLKARRDLASALF